LSTEVFGRRDSRLLTLNIAVLLDASQPVAARVAAVEFLEEIRGRKALDALIDGCYDRSRSVRWHCVCAIHSFYIRRGRVPRRVVETLVSKLDDFEEDESNPTLWPVGLAALQMLYWVAPKHPQAMQFREHLLIVWSDPQKLPKHWFWSVEAFALSKLHRDESLKAALFEAVASLERLGIRPISFGRVVLK